MKHLNLSLILLLCLAWAWPNKAQWKWREHTIISIREGDATLELGLCSDGTVVWREITTATNSPSEAAYTNFMIHAPVYIDTNWNTTIPLTNKLFH